MILYVKKKQIQSINVQSVRDPLASVLFTYFTSLMITVIWKRVFFPKFSFQHNVFNRHLIRECLTNPRYIAKDIKAEKSSFVMRTSLARFRNCVKVCIRDIYPYFLFIFTLFKKKKKTRAEKSKPTSSMMNECS